MVKLETKHHLRLQLCKIDLLQNYMDSERFLTNGEIRNQASPTTTAHVKRAVVSEKCSASHGQSQRRCSPRLKDVPQSKRPFYGTSLKVLRQLRHHHHHDVDDGQQHADYSLNHAIKVNDVDVYGQRALPPIVEQTGPPNGITQNAAGRDSVNDSGTTCVDNTSCAGNVAGNCQYTTTVEVSNNNWLQSYCISPTVDGKSAYALAKETIRAFNTYYLQLVQEVQTIRNEEEGNLQNDNRDLNQSVFLTNRHTLVPPPKLRGVLCMDISGGQEEIRIPAINVVDDMPFAPTGFTYSRSIQVAENVDLPPNADGCRCKGNCMNPKNCACARLNNSKFPYVRHNGGRLRKAKDVVFECGPNCGCGPDCINRISQQGIKYHLEVFRTLDKGWAVRTKDFIPSGAPVCEYVGILRRTDELDNVDVNDYIFEIDCLHTIKGIEGREILKTEWPGRKGVDSDALNNQEGFVDMYMLKQYMQEVATSVLDIKKSERRFGAVSGSLCDHAEKMEDGYLEKTPEFCIDANHIGNVSRFINHSCEPNLFVQCILSAHHDVRLARVVLFAARSIPPWQELTYDYGYPLDSVIGSDGKVKVQPCYCAAEDCRKRLY